MPVCFLIGRSRSGKTRWCLDRMAEECRQDPLGPAMMYLVPEQATYNGEMALLTKGRLRGYTRAQVLSFTRIEHFVFALAPAPQKPRLTPTHRSLLATLLITRARRESNDPLIHAAGIEDALAALVAETKQYLVGPKDFRSAADRLGQGMLAEERPDAPACAMLQRKLAALADLLEQFHQITGERFEDPAETVSMLAEDIAKTDLFAGVEIFVDGFYSFNPAEEKVLMALGRKAKALHIALLGDPQRAAVLDRGGNLIRDPVLQPAEETYTRLKALFRANDVPLETPRFLEAPEKPEGIAPTLVFVEDHFLRGRRRTCDDCEGICFLEAPTPREEARLAVEILAQWMQERGWQPEEVGILTRDLEGYSAALAQAFATLRLLYFIDRSEPLETHPLVVGIQALVRAGLSAHETGHLIALGKSGLLPITRRAVDHLENYVIQYPRTPRQWYDPQPWAPPPSRSPFPEDEGHPGSGPDPVPDGINATRLQIADEVRLFRSAYEDDADNPGVKRGSGTFRDFLLAVIKTVDRNVRATGHEHPIDDKILARIGELFGDALEAAGDEEMDWETAGELVARTLAALTLPRIPPLLGEIFVGQVDRSRQPQLKGVVILGLVEGHFPRSSTNMSLINDTEREIAEAIGLELKPSTRRLYEREAMYAYRALTTSGQVVALSRPLASEQGNLLNPSPFWMELRRMFPNREPEGVPPRLSPQRSWRWSELAAAAVRTLDETHRRGAPAQLRAAQVLPVTGTPGAQQERDAVLAAAQWRNGAAISPAMLHAFLDGKLVASISQLESFSACPFKHFVSYLLRPRELMRPRFEMRDAGNFAHAVLAGFTRELRERDLLGLHLEEEPFEEVFEDAEQVPLKRVRASGLLENPLGNYVFGRLREQVHQLARWLADSLGELPMRPAYEEVRLADDPSHPFSAWEIGGLPGWDFSIRGQLDRVDRIGAEGGPQIIIDYKLGPRRFDVPGWYAAESLQLPVYMIAVGNCSDGKVAGGLYLQVLTKSEEDAGKRRYMGLMRASAFKQLMGGTPAWAKTPWVQGSHGDPEERPRAWGTPIADTEFEALLDKTEVMVRDLAGRLTTGDCRVYPSRRGGNSACSYCDYRSVCRLDYSVNKAHLKPSRSRIAVLEELRGEGEGEE